METAVLHEEVERSLGLPARITTLQEYGRCLRSFYSIYAPLEESMAHFVQWSRLGLDMHERSFTRRLTKDLLLLGIHEGAANPSAAGTPTMPDFAYAFGARYVLEGSTLGSQHILRHVRAVLGSEIDGADAFFRGHESRTGAMWNSFRIALDAYGMRFPEHEDHVVAGAMATFKSIGRGVAQ
jgi:heme oxygenase